MPPQKNISELFRNLRVVLLAIAYAFFFAMSLWLAYDLRFDFLVPEQAQVERLVALSFVIPLKLVCLWLFGQFRGLLSFFRIPDLSRLFFGLLLASTVLLIVRVLEPTGLQVIPRGVLLADFLLSLILLVGFRMGLRVAREKFNQKSGGRRKKTERIGVIGAGSTGATLAAEFLAKPHLGVNPVVFFDDDPGKVGRDIHGIPIVPIPESFEGATDRFVITTVAIAIPSLNGRRVREILESARAARLETTIIPSLHELSTGRVKIEEMRNIEVEDLLGRESVLVANDSIRDFVKERVVLVTGAGGSIGSEIVRQVASFNPARILLLDHSELAVFSIEQEMRENESGASVTALVADICEPLTMRKILKRYRPAIIFHAAAYKHVPLMETQPWEAVANNAVGTLRIGSLAREFGVERFVLVSTDKAINPTSVMGASKRLAEMAVQSLQESSACAADATGRSGTKFCSVRFGNVLGSSGSVIPTFRRQIERGGPVTVTHPDVTRYFMTIPEAVGLVLQAAAIGEGGEIFLLDMGKPVKIIDLARQMIQLSGFEPDTEIEIEITGLRPGEKLFEELNYETENSEETVHPRIRALRTNLGAGAEFEEWMVTLEQDLLSLSESEVKDRIRERVTEYTPFVE
ncbi:MAG: nucleoside-diphosphate sugar epimerase/dehydratase [Verrucomicrobiota bacterium]